MSNNPSTWHERAICAQIDVGDVFFPEGKGAGAGAAKRICRQCTVTVECLRDALRHEANYGYRYGVYGGLSANERSRLVAGKAVYTSRARLANVEDEVCDAYTSGLTLDEVAVRFDSTVDTVRTILRRNNVTRRVGGWRPREAAG